MNQNSRDVWIDGGIYAALGVLGFSQTFFAGHDAERFLGEQALFWMRGGSGGLVVLLSSIRAFRSQIFSKARNESANGNGTYPSGGSGHTTILGK